MACSGTALLYCSTYVRDFTMTRDLQWRGVRCSQLHVYVCCHVGKAGKYQFIERHGRVVNTPALYSEGPEFKSMIGDQLS
jgi:hypothetical protein